MRAKLISVILATVISVACVAQEVLNVGILRDRSISSIMLQAKVGSYLIKAGDKELILRPNDGLSVKLAGREIVARTMSDELRSTSMIEVIPRSDVSRIRIRSSRVDVAARLYQGTMQLRRDGGTLKCGVEIPIEQYVAGVVQSESGKGRHAEYYKLQSIICRTYALANMGKHAHEGFHVCDETHCQVFKGGSDHAPIVQAVKATEGQVLVDSDINYVDATFHSNCGGETVNSEDVWTKQVTYLRAVKDKYCHKATHSKWYKTIPTQEWLNYLKHSFNLNVEDEQIRSRVLNYEPMCRDIYLANLFPLMPLDQVRKDWNLKSTFFSISESEDKVVLEGTGFGHGVGMCQEGAMVMALTDKDFRQILHHYYSDVHLIDMDALEFFRDSDLTELLNQPVEEVLQR